MTIVIIINLYSTHKPREMNADVTYWIQHITNKTSQQTNKIITLKHIMRKDKLVMIFQTAICHRISLHNIYFLHFLLSAGLIVASSWYFGKFDPSSAAGTCFRCLFSVNNVCTRLCRILQNYYSLNGLDKEMVSKTQYWKFKSAASRLIETNDVNNNNSDTVTINGQTHILIFCLLDIVIAWSL